MKLSALFCMCLMTMLLFSVGNPVSAEIYQFTDENGETHYTNDATTIPRQYRDDVDIQGETIVYGDYDYSDQSAPSSDSDEENSGIEQQPQGNLSGVESLRAQEAAFDNEFKALEEDRKRLDQIMRKAHTKEEVDAANQATMEFNEQYKDWHRRRKAFKEQVKAYNEQVRQDMEQQLEEYKATKSSSDSDDDL